MNDQLLDALDRDGFAGPFRLSSAGRKSIAFFQASLDEFLEARSTSKFGQIGSKHLESHAAFSLCSDGNVVSVLHDLMGTDIVIYDSKFAVKEPGGRIIPWHQDILFFRSAPAKSIGVWMAIDRCHDGNGCLEFIRGSHKSRLAHVDRTDRISFGAVADPRLVERDKAENVLLDPGEFVVFHTDILHHSRTNMSLNRRAGFVAWYCSGDGVIDHDAVCPGHYCLVLSGQTLSGQNRVGAPPVDDTSESTSTGRAIQLHAL